MFVFRKDMKHYTFFILSFLICPWIWAQDVQQNLGDFDEIEVFDKLKVKLIPSHKNSIEISGAKSENVQIVQKNNLLKLRMNLENFLQGDQNNSIIVYYKTLRRISASEGAQITSTETIDINKLSLEAKEGASIDLDIQVNTLEVKTNTGAGISLTGTTNYQSVICNTKGYYNGQELEASEIEVTVNAGGEAHVFATELVNAKTRAGGNIYIYGQPKVKQQTIAGGKIHIK